MHTTYTYHYDIKIYIILLQRTFDCNSKVPKTLVYDTSDRYLTIRLDVPPGRMGGFTFRIILATIEKREYI